jgi:hypothetical protein
MLTGATLPEHLADAAEAPRVVETFGLGPWLVAVALAAADVYFVAGPGRAALGVAEVAVLALLFASAVACVGYDVRRRRRRAVLVATDSADGVCFGVYREGQLEGVLNREALVASRAHEPGGAKAVLALAFVAVAFLGHGVTEEGDLTSRLVAFGPGVWLALLAGSFARAAALCASFHLPGSRSKAWFSRAELAAMQ